MSLTEAEEIELLALLEAEEAATRRAVEIAALQAGADAIRDRCRRFSGFVREAWPILEPTNPLKWSWHLDAMCDHLEAISMGKLRPRLIINVPPGSSKSMIVSVLWQAWEWTFAPSIRYLTTSFEEENVKRDTRKTRDLIRSEWYRTLWPDVILSRAGETSFASTAMGTREGVPFASITGKRGDRFVIDDPHSLDGAESEAERTRAVRRFLEGGLNRVNDQTTSAIVVVMQRLHEGDLSGALLALANAGFVHLMIPMEFEPERRCVTPLPWADPRTEPGQLMDPVRMPREALEILRGASEYAYAGQYQQRPSPREGGLFKRAKIGEVIAAPADCRRCRAWDFAGTKSARADYTAGVRLAYSREGDFYVEGVVRGRWEPTEVEAQVLDTARADGTRVDVRIPQDPGQAGKAQAQTMTKLLLGYTVTALPPTGDKVTRARPAAAQVGAGNVYVVRTGNPDEDAWIEPFLSELGMFPAGLHDDQVDAFADALNHLALPVMKGAAIFELARREAEALRAGAAPAGQPPEVSYAPGSVEYMKALMG